MLLQSSIIFAMYDLKTLLFADQSLAEIARTIAGTKNEPWSLFAAALENSQQGDHEAAKQSLQKILSLPDPESRVCLLAWRCLRALGEQPSAEIASHVQGVVCELHNEAGVSTIASYADGSVRWLGAQGRITIWDARHSNAHIDALINGLLRSAEKFVGTKSPLETHLSSEPALNYFRVTVLTFAGVYVEEVFGPDIDQLHQMFPLLVGSVDLLDALSAMNRG